MKGPGFRIGLDVRRVWRCAKCGRTVRTSGQIVSQRCGCSESGHWMVLQPPVKREPFCPPAREPLFDPGAEEPQSRSPSAAVEAIGDAACGAAVPAAPAQAEHLQHNSAESPATDHQSQIEESSPVTIVPPEPAERAPELPAAAEPGDAESAREDSPPDDFGAGLGNE